MRSDASRHVNLPRPIACALAALVAGTTLAWIDYVFFAQIVAGPLVPQRWADGFVHLGRQVAWPERLGQLLVAGAWRDRLPLIANASLVALAGASSHAYFERSVAWRRWAAGLFAAVLAALAWECATVEVELHGEIVPDPGLALRLQALAAWAGSRAIVPSLVAWCAIATLAMGLSRVLRGDARAKSSWLPPDAVSANPPAG